MTRRKPVAADPELVEAAAAAMFRRDRLPKDAWQHLSETERCWWMDEARPAVVVGAANEPVETDDA